VRRLRALVVPAFIALSLYAAQINRRSALLTRRQQRRGSAHELPPAAQVLTFIHMRFCLRRAAPARRRMGVRARALNMAKEFKAWVVRPSRGIENSSSRPSITAAHSVALPSVWRGWQGTLNQGEPAETVASSRWA